MIHRKTISSLRGTSRKAGRWSSASLDYLFLVFISILSLFPLIWIVISSFKTSQSILSSALSLPESLHWENYVKAFKVTNLLRAFRNSILVASGTVVLNAFVALLGAYTLTRFRFRLREPITVIIVLGIILPYNAAILPVKMVMMNLGLDNTLIGLILLYASFGIPLSLLILRSFLSSIPMALDEAARVDGATHSQVLFRIIMPLCQSSLVSVMIINFLFSWNEFLFALLLLSSDKIRTLQVSIKFFVGKFFYDYGALFAAMVLVILPSLVVFIILQEKVIKGMSSGALKG